MCREINLSKISYTELTNLNNLLDDYTEKEAYLYYREHSATPTVVFGKNVPLGAVLYMLNNFTEKIVDRFLCKLAEDFHSFMVSTEGSEFKLETTPRMIKCIEDGHIDGRLFRFKQGETVKLNAHTFSFLLETNSIDIPSLMVQKLSLEDFNRISDQIVQNRRTGDKALEKGIVDYIKAQGVINETIYILATILEVQVTNPTDYSSDFFCDNCASRGISFTQLLQNSQNVENTQVSLNTQSILNTSQTMGSPKKNIPVSFKKVAEKFKEIKDKELKTQATIELVEHVMANIQHQMDKTFIAILKDNIGLLNEHFQSEEHVISGSMASFLWKYRKRAWMSEFYQKHFDGMCKAMFRDGITTWEDDQSFKLHKILRNSKSKPENTLSQLSQSAVVAPPLIQFKKHAWLTNDEKEQLLSIYIQKYPIVALEENIEETTIGTKRLRAEISAKMAKMPKKTTKKEEAAEIETTKENIFYSESVRDISNYLDALDAFELEELINSIYQADKLYSSTFIWLLIPRCFLKFEFYLSDSFCKFILTKYMDDKIILVIQRELIKYLNEAWIIEADVNSIEEYYQKFLQINNSEIEKNNELLFERIIKVLKALGKEIRIGNLRR